MGRHSRAPLAGVAGLVAGALAIFLALGGCVQHRGGLVHLRSGECKRGDPLAGVYLPFRLHVKRACITVKGTVECVRHEPDGDTHILLSLDRRYRRILTPANAFERCPVARGHGGGRLLVVEVIPQEELLPVPDNSAELGGFVTPGVPRPGRHVTVTGPYVLDTNALHDLIFAGKNVKNWAEIHPAWNITVDHRRHRR